MTQEQREERAKLYAELVKLITTANTDTSFLQRTLWADEIVTALLTLFSSSDCWAPARLLKS